MGEIFGPAADGDQFRRNADGNFFGRERANVQSHRRMHVRELFRGDAFFFQRAVNRQNLALAANHSNITRRRSDGPAKHVHIILVAARNDYHVRCGAGLDLRKRFLEAGVTLLSHREALSVGERFAVIDNANRKTGSVRGVGQRNRYVAAAKNVQHRLRKDGFDENFERAAANQSVVVVGFIVQAERHFARSFGLHDFFRSSPDLGLNASATDGSGDRAIFANEHPRAFVARNRAVGMDDSRQRSALSFTAELDHFFKEIHREAPENRAWALPRAHINQDYGARTPVSTVLGLDDAFWGGRIYSQRLTARL